MNSNRFEALCSRNSSGCPSAVVQGWFETIQSHYREPHRRYHTPEHVDHCLRQFDAVPDLIQDRDALEFAIWYHDVIYEIADPENERKSAQLFKDHAGACMPEGFVSRVYDLIMVTVHSSVRPQTSDQEFMVDIDLSSFGLPWPKFLEDSIAVREESPHLTDDEFYPRQVTFLRGLLERPHFCHTRFFRERHETQARNNIARYLAELRSDGLVSSL